MHLYLNPYKTHVGDLSYPTEKSLSVTNTNDVTGYTHYMCSLSIVLIPSWYVWSGLGSSYNRAERLLVSVSSLFSLIIVKGMICLRLIHKLCVSRESLTRLGLQVDHLEPSYSPYQQSKHPTWSPHWYLCIFLRMIVAQTYQPCLVLAITATSLHLSECVVAFRWHWQM